MKTHKPNKKGLAIMLAIPLAFLIAMLAGCGMGYGNMYAQAYPPMMGMAPAPGTMIPTAYNGRAYYGGSVYGGSRYDANMAPYMAAMNNVREQAKASVIQQPLVTMVPAPVNKNGNAAEQNAANGGGNGASAPAIEQLINELDSQNKRVDVVERKVGIAPSAPAPTSTPASAPVPAPATPAPVPATPTPNK